MENCNNRNRTNRRPMNMRPVCNQQMQQIPLAMAYVRVQQWGDIYEPEYAFSQGTLFKDLNKIFCGERC